MVTQSTRTRTSVSVRQSGCRRKRLNPLPAVAVIFLLVMLLVPQHASTSKCIVGKWQEWSECYGSCDFAQRVRNRDVIRAPLPERNPAIGHQCPPLFEVQSCRLRECEDEEGPFAIANRAPLGSEFEEAPDKRRRPVSRSLPLANRDANRPACGLAERPLPCCPVERSGPCSDGSKPRQIIKWHRLRDETFCRPYHYPYCGATEERMEAPLKSETACSELCFTAAEKAIFPGLRLL